MATEILMPKLSDTMTEGHFGTWRKAIGERVERGDIIAEVETDKAVMDLESFTSGILLEQRVKPGDQVLVGSVIGLIGEAGEAVHQLNADGAIPLPLADSESKSIAATVPEVEISAPDTATSTEDLNAAQTVQAAPVVRRRAAELGIDLLTVKGSGPGGRIMLENLQQSVTETVAPAFSERAAASLAITPQNQPFSRMRNAIASTTTSSWQKIPHFYLSRDLDMTRAEKLVRELKNNGTAVTLNTIIMGAVAAVLTRFPELNRGYEDGGGGSTEQVNLGFAVALPDGLQVPVIREAETMGLRDLSRSAKQLAEKAHQGSLTPADISGGSFTVSNLGMYGVDTIASIIMPGQAAILGTGAVTDRPVVRKGEITVGRVMTATLSCDHRIVDGAVAAKFLNELKNLLEEPDGLTI